MNPGTSGLGMAAPHLQYSSIIVGTYCRDAAAISGPGLGDGKFGGPPQSRQPGRVKCKCVKTSNKTVSHGCSCSSGSRRERLDKHRSGGAGQLFSPPAGRHFRTATLQTSKRSRSNKNKSPQPDFIYVGREEKCFGERCRRDKGGESWRQTLVFCQKHCRGDI